VSWKTKDRKSCGKQNIGSGVRFKITTYRNLSLTGYLGYIKVKMGDQLKLIVCNSKIL